MSNLIVLLPAAEKKKIELMAKAVERMNAAKMVLRAKSTNLATHVASNAAFSMGLFDPKTMEDANLAEATRMGEVALDLLLVLYQNTNDTEVLEYLERAVPAMALASRDIPK